MPSLRIAFFNVQDFYLLLDRRLTREELEALEEDDYQAMNRSIYDPNKSREKLTDVGRILLEQDFDVVGLCEVGGMETLSAFNRIYLEGRYDCHLHEEKSGRGIYVGVLLKRGRFPGAWSRPITGVFSRNLLRVNLGPDAGKLQLFIVHLKSQHGADYGLQQRVEEVKALAAIVPQENCVVMGDFNGVLIRGSHQFEFEPFLALPFRDVLEAMKVPENLRRTHYHFAPSPTFTQLDYIFISNEIKVASGGVLEEGIPLNRTQRNYLASDHLPIWAEIAPTATPEH